MCLGLLLMFSWGVTFLSVVMRGTAIGTTATVLHPDRAGEASHSAETTATDINSSGTNFTSSEIPPDVEPSAEAPKAKTEEPVAPASSWREVLLTLGEVALKAVQIAEVGYGFGGFGVKG